MVLDLVFDGFSCISTVYIIQNLKIPDIFMIFENIGQKWANFCQKWVPKLKIAMSQKHIFDYNLRMKHGSKLKFCQVMGKMIEKTCTIYIFEFWPYFEKNGLCMLQNRFFRKRGHFYGGLQFCLILSLFSLFFF